MMLALQMVAEGKVAFSPVQESKLLIDVLIACKSAEASGLFSTQ
jgi:hypothetical protein